jgi:hypothetical protein
MNPVFVAPIFGLIKDILGRVLPDNEARRKAEIEVLQTLQNQDFETVLKQLEINAKEAAHPSRWVSGGRPFFIWIGGVGFLYAVLIQPLLVWWATIKGWPTPPDVNIDLLWVVISGLLGLGTMRSFDKLKGTSK